MQNADKTAFADRLFDPSQEVLNVCLNKIQTSNLILTNSDVKVTVDNIIFPASDKMLGSSSDFAVGETCLVAREDHCLECASSTMVPLYTDGAPSAACIEQSACVSTATQLYTFHSDANVCSTSPTTPFCKVENENGCTECIRGYYIDEFDPSTGVCKFVADDFPNCLEVSNSLCT